MPDSDFEIVEVPEGGDPELMCRVALRVATEDMLARGFDPLYEVQVLTPMHGGPVGTRALNEAFRSYHVPGDRGSVTIHGRQWAPMGARRQDRADRE